MPTLVTTMGTAAGQPPELGSDALAAIAADVSGRFGSCPGGAAGMRSWLGLPEPAGRAASAPYDLTTAAFDLPPAPTKRSLLLVGTYRSGSTLVAEALTEAGGYGCPLEYFQAGAAERRYRRWLGGPTDYRAQVLAARTDSSGVFGAKLFYPDISVLTGLDDLMPADVPEAISAALPAPVYLWLRRRDVVGQAVSALRALQSDRWRVLAGDAADDSAVPYDFDRLYQLTGMFARQDADWQAAVSASAAPHLEIWYDDLAAAPADELRRLLARLADLGLPPERTDQLGAPRLTRQAGPASTDAVARFTADLARRP